MTRYIDSHAHLTSRQLVGHTDELAQRAQSARLDYIVNICTNLESLEAGIALHQKYPWIVNAGATTPHDVTSEGEELFPRFAQAANEGALVAVGETGLDYFYEHSDRATQKLFLERYLALALECQLPIIIHCRDAFQDLFEILDHHYCPNGLHAPGVLHCFTGTLEEARQVLNRGWFLSLSGIVTFKKSDQLRDVARFVPLDRLLIETDSPYLAPQSHRGQINEPSYLAEVAQVIADTKLLPKEAVAEATHRNACSLFRLAAAFR